jgi:hypothetical protein
MILDRSGRSGKPLVWLVAAALPALLLSGCAQRSLGAGSGQPEPSLPPPQENLQPDWDHPLAGAGVQIPDINSVLGELSFTPIEPKALGTPLSIFMTDPTMGPQDGRVVSFVYQSDLYGRFQVTEGVSQTTQAELEALAKCDPAAGCQGAWSLVTVQQATTALLIAGPTATSIVWLDGDTRFDVVGPTETFSSESAMAVADDF